MSDIKKTSSGIFINNVPDNWTRDQKLELINKLEATGKPYTGSYEGTLKALEPDVPVDAQSGKKEDTTDPLGLLGGFVRGAGGPAAAAVIGGALGSPGGPVGIATGAKLGAGAYTLAKLATPVITDLMNTYLGTNQMNMRQVTEKIFTDLGIPEPDSAAERVMQAAAEGLGDTAGTASIGSLMQGPPALVKTLSENIGKFMTEKLGTQLVEDTLSGAGAQIGSEIAESADLGTAGQIAMPLIGAVAGSGVGAPTTALGRKAFDTGLVKGMELPANAQSAIRSATGKGDLPTSAITEKFLPNTISTRFKRNLAERFNRQEALDIQTQRQQSVNRTLEQFDVAEGTVVDDIVQDVADDYYITRSDSVNTNTSDKKEVLNNITDRVASKEGYELRKAPIDAEGTTGPRATQTGETGTDIVPTTTSRINYLANPDKTLATTPGREVGGFTPGLGPRRAEANDFESVNRVKVEPNGSVAEAYDVFKVEPDRAMPTPRTDKYIQDQYNKFGVEGKVDDTSDPLKQIGLRENQALMNKLEDWQQAVESKDLITMDAIRKQIGESLTGQEGIKPIDRTVKDGVYGAIREDIADYIRANGSEAEFEQWDKATANLSELADDFNNTVLKELIDSKGTSLESAQRALFTGNRDATYRLYKNLSPEGQERSRSALIAKMASEAEDLETLSPSQFAREIKNYGGKVGILFSKEDAQQLEGLKKYLAYTKRSETISDTVESGLPLPGGAPGQKFALSRALWGNPLVGLGVSGASAVGGKNWANHYESPAVRDKLIKLANLADNVTGGKEEEQMKRITEILRSQQAAMQNTEDRREGER